MQAQGLGQKNISLHLHPCFHWLCTSPVELWAPKNDGMLLQKGLAQIRPILFSSFFWGCWKYTSAGNWPLFLWYRLLFCPYSELVKEDMAASSCTPLALHWLTGVILHKLIQGIALPTGVCRACSVLRVTLPEWGKRPEMNLILLWLWHNQ